LSTILSTIRGVWKKGERTFGQWLSVRKWASARCPLLQLRELDVFVLLLREEVAKTVLDPGDIRAEIHALYKALVTTEGRLER